MKLPEIRPERAAKKIRQQADEARDRRDWAEAARLYRLYVEQNPESAAIWVQLGNCLKEAGDLPQAEAAYLRALSIAPASADAHLQLGHVEKLAGRLDAALQRYRRALDHDPTLVSAQEEVERLTAPAPAAPPEQAPAPAPSPDWSAQLKAAEEKIAGLAAQLRPLADQASVVRALSAENARLRQRIEALETKQADLGARAGQAETAARQELRALADRLGLLEAQSPPVKGQFSALLAYLQAQDRKLAALNGDQHEPGTR